MACMFKTPAGSKRLVVKAFNTTLTSRSSSLQLRNYSSPSAKSVQQDSLDMSIQTASRGDYNDLVYLLRQSQLNSLNDDGGSSYILWPERDIAYKVYVKNIPVRASLQDVAPLVNISFGTYINLINTEEASITGHLTYSDIISGWADMSYEDFNDEIRKGAGSGSKSGPTSMIPGFTPFEFTRP